MSARPRRSPPPTPSASTHVVLLRGANVGGRVFHPKALERDLTRFGVVSLGAAGTFVAHRSPGPEKLQEAIARRLPFQAEMSVLPGDQVLGLVASSSWRRLPQGEGLRRWVAVLLGPPTRSPKLPIDDPEGGDWDVRALSFQIPFVMGIRHLRGPGTAYPSTLVEKAFGVPATVRWGEVLEQVCEVLRAGSP
jgi:hypothetical protein